MTSAAVKLSDFLVTVVVIIGIPTWTVIRMARRPIRDTRGEVK